MFVVSSTHRPTEHGKCCPSLLCSLINYPAELSWKDVIGHVGPTNRFRRDASPQLVAGVARR